MIQQSALTSTLGVFMYLQLPALKCMLSLLFLFSLIKQGKEFSCGKPNAPTIQLKRKKKKPTLHTYIMTQLLSPIE